MFIPLRGRLLVEREAGKTQTPGGLYLADESVEQPSIGTVISSSDTRYIANGVKVYFGRYSGTDIVINDKKYLILRFDDLLGFEPQNA